VNRTEQSNVNSTEDNSKKNDQEQNLISLNLNLNTLIEFKNSLIEEQKNGETKIQEINEKIERTKKQVDKERQSLEELRIRLKEINGVKDEEFPKFMELKDQVMKARNQMKVIDEKTGVKNSKERTNIKQLTRTLEQLERDIQTKKLSKDEERRLVVKSKEIATKLHALKVIHKKEDQFRMISTQYGSLKSKINDIFDKKSEFGNKIGDLKQVLDNLLDTRENLYEERRKIIRAMRESAAKLEMVDTQINAIEFRKSKITAVGSKRRFRDLRDKPYVGLQSPKERTKRNKENIQIWNSMKEQALKKMSSGEKLTFDEMKLIYSDMSSSEL
jgi:uncharacterized coiled-coil DUF342 family protein